MINLIYAGGTFGCHGSPLAPLDADIFLPQLEKQLSTNNYQMKTIKNKIVKDSSQLNPSDFFHFYQLLLKNYQLGCRQFVLITGTDTLSYLGAFLAECFAQSDILICLTASMKPLFHAEQHELQIDKDSDAWENLQGAISHCQKNISGIFVCLNKQNYFAQSVKKQHSHAINAFVGDSEIEGKTASRYPANSYQQLTENSRQLWIKNRYNQLAQLKNNLQNLAIVSLFVMPNDVSILQMQLQSLIDTSTHKNQQLAIILQGFGAGNIPYSSDLAELFQLAHKNGYLMISTSQCSFGGVSASYQAGSWQYQHQVLSAEDLTVETIFSRLLWIYLNYSMIDECREQWQQLLG
ncbi:MAG: asparaginase [Moraxellaceae bacterium]|nr:asparaginase [Moraxellaceae bacterium]